mgnify:CR=1 FL=1
MLTTLPGLIDAHVHFGWFSWAMHQGEIDLDNVPTKAEAVARVAGQTRKVPAGQWIQGAGWNKNIWPDPSFPSAADLDAVSREHPVALEDKSHHATWVNSRALELAGITAALCAGATLCEAALVGNLVASVTIQQIGTTGTATIKQILAHHALLE